MTKRNVPSSDPFMRGLMQASEDDESYDLEDQKASDEAWEQYLQGDVRSWREVRHEMIEDDRQG